MKSPAEEVTMLLEGVGRGDADAAARLMEVVYEQLRGLAASYAASNRPDHTLQPTALVHEAFVEAGAEPESAVQRPAALFRGGGDGDATQILADYARAERAWPKRGGGGGMGAG